MAKNNPRPSRDEPGTRLQTGWLYYLPIHRYHVK